MGRIVFLTGAPGAGKTTAIIRIVEHLRSRSRAVRGFYTEEVRQGPQRVGFDLVELGGERNPMARKNPKGIRRIGAYGVLVENVDDACRRLRAAASKQSPDAVLVLDEIGPMELYSREFQRLVVEALTAAHPLLATVKQTGGPFTEALLHRADASVVEVTVANRDEIPLQVVGLLP